MAVADDPFGYSVIVVGYPSHPVPNGPWIMIRAMAAARAAPGFMIAVTYRQYVRKSYRDHESHRGSRQWHIMHSRAMRG